MYRCILKEYWKDSLTHVYYVFYTQYSESHLNTPNKSKHLDTSLMKKPSATWASSGENKTIPQWGYWLVILLWFL